MTPPPPPSNGNGISLPRKIPFSALGIILAVFAQFVGLIVWASNEHSSRVELQHRFDTTIAEAKDMNRGQDAFLQRLEDQAKRIPVIEERANLVLRTMQDTQRAVAENAGQLRQVTDLNRRNTELLLEYFHRLRQEPPEPQATGSAAARQAAMSAYSRPSLIRQYSIEIGGRATSISLEPQFYAGLQAIAAARGVSVSNVLTELHKPKSANLASEARLSVLRFYQLSCRSPHSGS